MSLVITSPLHLLDSQRNKRRKTQKLEYPEVVLCNKVKCKHLASIGNMCIICGERVGIQESGVRFGYIYIHKSLSLGNDEIDRLRSACTKNLVSQRKLCLVLDLDHTLLHSTRLIDLKPEEEEYLKAQPDFFMLEFINMTSMTKLRPFVHKFLKEASKMFEMYIYTMGNRAYALDMAKLLDPRGDYFNGSVISKEDNTQKGQKGLDVIPGQERAVVILDDTEKVWMKHKDNLILMEEYHFFAPSCDQFGSQLKTDETEHNGALVFVLEALKRIHHMFFDDNVDVGSRDVRKVMKTVRKEVLQGCKIVFSRVFPIGFPVETHALWKMAEQLGATCSTETDASVTHVVSKDAGTEKSLWAVKEHKFLVDPQWIEAANFLWQKLPEEYFPVLRLYDVDCSQLRFEALSEAALLDCCFQEESVVFSAGSDCSITRYDLNSGISNRIGNHDDIATFVEYSNETHQVITAGFDKKIIAWDMRGAEPLAFLRNLGAEVESMSLSGFELTVAVGSSVDIYDLRNLDRSFQSNESCMDVQIRCVCSIPYCKGYAVGSVDGRVKLEFSYPSTSDNMGYIFRCCPKSTDARNHLVPVNDIAFNPFISGAFVTGDSKGYVTAWDAKSRRRLFELPRCSNSVASLTYNHEGQVLAVASSYTYNEAIELEKPPQIFVYKMDDSYIRSVSAGNSNSK
ncbi:hypothetical protein CCACVL1_06523 [Corchorus capsularis]|uniref:RNA polymerase II C-terminal domain phosphatase-like n=1 Tax=Corchorus capsularis TaxID=210143 RepID=A0A1R3JEV0_COCAP|nr:hypothetical protein CCACVL1_06523 [Corchorus capsularis]